MNHVNLHIHSISSDGILSGNEIVKKAVQLNLRVISITDHDAIDESRKVVTKLNITGLKVISGVELTATYPSGMCHVLGYGIDYEQIDNFSKRIRQSRINNSKIIIKKLQDSGYVINYDEVLKISTNNVIGRRDIARILVRKNYFDTEDDAINTLLFKNKPFYIETPKNPIEDCVSIIKESGGIPILAHPWTLNLSIDELEKFILLYKFEGIEVYNNTISQKMYYDLNLLADKLNIYKTCGTDYHGQKGLNDFIVNESVDCSKILRKL